MTKMDKLSEFKESLNRLNSIKERIRKKEENFLEWVLVRYAEDPNVSIKSIVDEFFDTKCEEQEQTLSIRKSST